MMTPHILSKIKKLLALSESPNEHEASAALAKAQQLMLEPGISAADLEESEFVIHESHHAFSSVPIESRYIRTIVHKHFFCEVVWMTSRHDKPRFRIVGRDEHVLIAEYVWDYLYGVYRTLWRGYSSKLSSRMKRRTRIQAHHDFLLGAMSAISRNLENSLPATTEDLIVNLNAKLDEHIQSLGAKARRVSNEPKNSKHAQAGYVSGKEVTVLKPVQDGRKRNQLERGS